MTNRFTSNIPQLASWVGFDRIFDGLERVTEQARKTVTYPPYNVKKVDDNHYVIEMAVAGFGKSDIDITTHGDQLVINGEVKSDDNEGYIYKGIANRAFERSFTLADSVIVKNASLVNGMLKVWLESFIPDEKKPNKVTIHDEETPEPKAKKQFLTE